MKIEFSSLPTILNGEICQLQKDYTIENIFIDSRNAVSNIKNLFIAIKGERHDGHNFIADLYSNGIRNFIIDEEIKVDKYPEANFFKTENSINALQALAGYKRKNFKGNLIGITGSNGKTIVKEWLAKLIESVYSVYRSPRSYNSQVGVPLSLWHLNHYQDYAIIEAGISKMGEMEKLEAIIKPKIGIYTNLGTAHDEGFPSLEEKAHQKAQLFKDSSTIIFCKDFPEISNALHSLPKLEEKEFIGWSFEDNTSNYFVETEGRNNGTAIRIPFEEQFHIFQVPFQDYASLENITHCLLLLLHEGLPIKVIQNTLNDIKSLNMRLETKKGKNSTYLVDDSYNNDLVGLDTALQFFSQQKQFQKRILILSDLLETGLSSEVLYQQLADRIALEKLNLVVGIGSEIRMLEKFYTSDLKLFPNTASFLEYEKENSFQESLILIKGARKFNFESIVQRLEQKIHGTVLEIDLNKITHNLNFYRARLKPGVKTMVMVKAFAYGSSSHEIANWLEFQNVDYLAVAYADEGVILRQHGIQLPIMVMNPDPRSFELLHQYNLEPELYSETIFKDYASYTRNHKSLLKVHLKLDTGMHRLGFEAHEIEQLQLLLRHNPQLKVASIFSHLAASDEAMHNGFSAQQAMSFKKLAESLVDFLGYKPILHLLNSPGISRFPDYQFDMVRLGIGLYGVDPTGIYSGQLQSVSTLKTVISQVKHIKKGETIGYARRGVANEDMKTATISIGYADGFNRKFSQGIGKVLINGILAPVIGNVCMDMTMVEVTNIDCKAGDEVIVFGEGPNISDMASAIDTIPYEILTNISERVKRVFYTE
ncbi:bifunctional UDP-N-acetylmuramoyl-tripeptide:D-alanyl-D-alanine ligase/alanine racemase [Marivirga tractuosa]|uniref:Alanine racemase n=1 Tax=Marivirga tractuosa (strain ATCC 23168 / DSM 4126 / NBRC 15989 / NCIMB 1408 / VKM B-1430 / H-43) TaxID=643867 RepID=E4TME0_MARTH|nr:bifunctional UDP-N-acetylmuramoyl-tripeptide:D-alanyl-D-alanine ligase/alanine racemase [Marivirga tractuosa]ADR22399.1 alanine racemase [Marivirga tractuosa DSM 4126]BDD16930.1 bifunctional UDP-N-acetylmuramoyl-tripeptide:D-alanyl-D-alanine ligase/alanine racemase [Marivirga tractuosa]